MRKSLVSVTPYLIKDKNNPDGFPIDLFDDIRFNTINNRQQFYHYIIFPFHGNNREGAKVIKGIQDN